MNGSLESLIVDLDVSVSVCSCQLLEVFLEAVGKGLVWLVVCSYGVSFG